MPGEWIPRSLELEDEDNDGRHINKEEKKSIKCQYKESIIKEARVMGSMSITSLDVTYKRVLQDIRQEGCNTMGASGPPESIRKGVQNPWYKIEIQNCTVQVLHCLCSIVLYSDVLYSSLSL